MSFLAIGGDTTYFIHLQVGSTPSISELRLYNSQGQPAPMQSWTPTLSTMGGTPCLQLTYATDPDLVFINWPGAGSLQLFRRILTEKRNVMDGTRTLLNNAPVGECCPPVEEFALWHSAIHADGGPIWIKDAAPITPPGDSSPMSHNIVQLKRRLSGDTGAPVALLNAELAFNEVGKVLYYGLGADPDGNALSIIPIAGEGAFLSLTGDQTLVGIKTFSGELHVALPTLPTQVTNKQYVDAAIAQIVAQTITGAFQYQGSLSATLNTLPANPVQGDLYRITAEGNFGDVTTFIANVSDFIVWNGTTWDKIDNTDPTLSNTDGKITVSKTGENSYVINLAADWQGGTQITQLGTITAGVWNASIIPLNYGGTGADLSNALDGTLFKKMGAAFVPAVVGIDFVKTNFGTINGGTF